VIANFNYPIGKGLLSGAVVGKITGLAAGKDALNLH